MTAVKEQTAGLYASELAKAGFYALAYDAAYQGESGGEPHFLEDPYQRAWDNSAAADFLCTRPEVDAERIGVLGICASGGYVSFAAQTDTRLKAVATVSAADTGYLFRDGMPPGSTKREQLKEQLKLAGDLRTAEARGEQATLNPVLPEQWESLPAGTLWHDGGDFYLTQRGQHPRSCNRLVSRSIALLANYDSFRFNELISPRPYLMIAGSKADTLYMSEEGVRAAVEPKELFVVPDATHVDLYDFKVADHAKRAVAKLVDFFGQHIAA